MTKEVLYRKFGPKLIDALARVMLREINKLREINGLTEYTGQQFVDAISNELESIPDYDWMNEDI
jgi:hypothetical protein